MPKSKSSKTIHKLESELLPPVMHYLAEIGCQKVVSELRFFDRGIDVYGVKRSRKKLTYAVELKLTNWQRALQQAAVYQLCADYSFIALPIRIALTLDLRPFKESGVGVLTVRSDETVGVLLDAVKTNETRTHYVKAMTLHAEWEGNHVV
jgi:hypothetical protein